MRSKWLEEIEELGYLALWESDDEEDVRLRWFDLAEDCEREREDVEDLRDFLEEDLMRLEAAG